MLMRVANVSVELGPVLIDDEGACAACGAASLAVAKAGRLAARSAVMRAFWSDGRRRQGRGTLLLRRCGERYDQLILGDPNADEDGKRRAKPQIHVVPGDGRVPACLCRRARHQTRVGVSFD